MAVLAYPDSVCQAPTACLPEVSAIHFRHTTVDREQQWPLCSCPGLSSEASRSNVGFTGQTGCERGYLMNLDESC